jgi:hypothetical protein
MKNISNLNISWLKNSYALVLIFLLALTAACVPEAEAQEPAPQQGEVLIPAVEPSPTFTASPTSIPEAPLPVTPVGTVDFNRQTPPPPGTTEPQEMPAPGIPAPAGSLEVKAIQDLARRLNLNPNEIRLLEKEPVDWPDSSLGCPQPGFEYLTVITPGYRIHLEAGGQRYAYHTDQRDQIVLCDNGRPLP